MTDDDGATAALGDGARSPSFPGRAAGPARLFVLAPNAPRVARLVAAAASFSTSLGPGLAGVGALLNGALPARAEGRAARAGARARTTTSR